MRFRILVIMIILFGIVNHSYASHIRAGEIIAERINYLSFKFTLTVYANSLSPVDDQVAEFTFGDGTTSGPVNRASKTFIGNNTFKNVYETTHAYSGAGYFKVSYVEEYRNGGILNISNPDQTPFYVETFVSIIPQYTTNNPVILTVPPVDVAYVGRKFVHNAGAYDLDGDSISYKMIVPKLSSISEVIGYTTPPFTSSFSLDPISGNLVWQNPKNIGLYNIAFIIEEWKKTTTGAYTRIGYVLRDMQIRVENSLNNPPVLTLPKDTCVEVGTTITEEIKSTDGDSDPVAMYYYGPGVSIGTFDVINPQNVPASGMYTWTTGCTHIRNKPWSLLFKAEDRPLSDTMVDFKNWNILVKPSKPTSFQATSSISGIELTWNTVTCASGLKIAIYRKECNTLDLAATLCDKPLIVLAGYTKIAEISGSATSYIDTKVESGSYYCYRIVVFKDDVSSGTVSDMSCSGVFQNKAVIVAVRANNSGIENNGYEVHWIDPPSLTGPFTFDVYRSEENGAFVSICSACSSPYLDNSSIDTTKKYFYKILTNGTVFSDSVSTLLLSSKIVQSKVVLNFSQTAGFKTDSLVVYRITNNGSEVRLKTLLNDTGKFTDQSTYSNCDTLYYRIVRHTSFCDPTVLTVDSSISSYVKAVPYNTGKLKAPELVVSDCGGDLNVRENKLQWSDVKDPLCPNVLAYRIYARYYEDENEFLLYTSGANDFTFIHQDSLSTAYCYRIVAVNLNGTEGNSSALFCFDDCIYYELPNLITPNNDSYNDLFRPFPVPEGVRSVILKVYNRWGQMVYHSDASIWLDWPGVNLDGIPLSDDIYYYTAEVQYYRRKNKSDEMKTIKGWIQILDGKQQAND